jgi:hypothetical protein
MKSILYIATKIILIIYLFWEPIESYLGFQIFEVIQALFIFLLCVYLFFTDKTSFIKFVLFCISLNNLIDEILQKNDKLYLSEKLTGVAILIIAIYKYRNDRKRPESI